MSVFLGFIVIGIGILIYSLPGIIAFKRKHNNRMSITILNVLTGWTALGWIISIVWAFTNNTEKADPNTSA